jgi:glycerol-3-phosphate dehydrogenase
VFDRLNGNSGKAYIYTHARAISNATFRIANQKFQIWLLNSELRTQNSLTPSLDPPASSILFAVDRANIVIIGGGVVGCAVARAVSERWSDVFLVEQTPRLGMGASTRNSGVIHSGIYYPPGSLKAKMCVAGNRMLYEFCVAHNVPHRNCGKLVVAHDAKQEAKLEHLADNGRANGVTGLRLVDRAVVRAREPHIEAAVALEVPSTGIISAEDLIKTLARMATDQGASLLTHTRVVRLDPRADSVAVTLVVGEAGEDAQLSEETIEARCVINCAGLYADEIAAKLGNGAHRIYPVRGEYCELVRAKSYLVNNLVYPLPHSDGLSLGVHLTRTLWDTVLVGPTADYIADKNDYEKNRLPIEEFARRAMSMLPEIEAADLQLAYSGIRAKLVPPGHSGIADFVIERDAKVPCAIQLIGIESPGLTSSLAIAEHVASLAGEILN